MKPGWLFLWVLPLVACYPADDGGEVFAHMPSRVAFPLVADALQPSCGSLDCHGQRGRNLRLYGGRGLRLDPQNNSADEPTTDGEYTASYRSLTGLEPEALDAVVASGGSDPERLSLVRKARNTERHKGGLQLRPGDPLDRCLLSWLANQTAMDACARVYNAPRPQVDVPVP